MVFEDLVTVLPRGRYVLAVSGGVDSVALLDYLVNRQSGNSYTVTHVQHGIRGDEAEADAQFVEHLAASYGLPFERYDAQLGKSASEEAARNARYKFLKTSSQKNQATLVTAHHQDDAIETVLINLTRGSGWRGLAALRDEPDIRRPLLGLTKNQIKNYALTRSLKWREDSTNKDIKYLRNHIRHSVVTKLSKEQRQAILDLRHKQLKIRAAVGAEMSPHLDDVGDELIELDRHKLTMWPENVALEYLQTILKKFTGAGLQRPQLKRLLLFIKAAHPNKKWQPRSDIRIQANRDNVIVELFKN